MQREQATPVDPTRHRCPKTGLIIIDRVSNSRKLTIKHKRSSNGRIRKYLQKLRNFCRTYCK